MLMIVALAALVIPFPSEEIPEWKVLYIDENYLPGGDVEIFQAVENRYSERRSEYGMKTDKNGFVIFPAVYFWKSAGARMLAAAAHLFGRDTATTVSVSVRGPGCEASVSWTVGSGSRPDKLVCPR